MASITLVHRRGSRAGETDCIELAVGGGATIGRAPDALVAFGPHADRVVSRRHAQLRREGGTSPCWQIVDLQSRHGVFVNGRRVRTQSTLAVGDDVQLGTDGPVLSVTALS